MKLKENILKLMECNKNSTQKEFTAIKAYIKEEKNLKYTT